MPILQWGRIIGIFTACFGSGICDPAVKSVIRLFIQGGCWDRSEKMKEFSYILRDESGQRHEGVRRAVCQHDVLMWARDNGFVPISVEEVGAGAKKKRRMARGSGRVKSAHIANFCWQMATMMEGGISIIETLDTIADDMENVRFSKIISKIAEKIRAGESLSDGIGEFPETFDTLFHGMILAGETSGSMPMVLRRLADYFDNRDKLIRKVRGALAYPIFVVGFMFVIITIMAVVIIPQFTAIFDDIRGDMPKFTEIFLLVYGIMMSNALYIIVGGGVVFMLLTAYCRTKKGHERLGKFTLSLPLFGKLLLQAFMALFCRTMSALMSAGVSVLDSFDILGRMSKNDVIKHAVFTAKENIVKGSSISFSMAVARIFPKLVLKMVSVGEQSGTLPEVLERTADYYERKVDEIIDLMTKLLEPILIISVGGIVLVVVIAMYLPIFSISNV